MKIGVQVVIVVVSEKREKVPTRFLEREIAGVLVIPAGGLLYIISLLILDGNASLNGGELRFFSSSDSSAVVGGRWLTFRRGHCLASGRLGVITSDEIVRVIVYVNDWEFGTQLGNNCSGVA
ncbi:unnamed protein product [Citrullus colocynthis]|uniref:Uncharacterized protein n=1 Tax=Citrullus colocynthis TaxID=252529 RepID=A0ABP0Y693_9ROSI